MELDEFLYNLHFDIDKVRPVTVDVDWEDAPLSFKLYQGLPAVQLSLDAPFNIRACGVQTPDVKEIGDLCWYTYGLTKMSHALVPFSSMMGAGAGETHMAGVSTDGTHARWAAGAAGADAVGPQPTVAAREGTDAPDSFGYGRALEDPVMQLLRRYVPSGGGLYPSELYAYLKVEGLAQGVYHYDVAHHRLVLLREGNFDTYLETALGHRVEMSRCFATFFVSTMFWKNYYKYHNFSYRLQALDAGALMGQLVEVAKQFGYASRVCLDFLDRAVNHLLGLSDEEESVYAVIPFSTNENGVGTRGSEGEAPANAERREFAAALCSELPPLHHRHYVKSRRVAEYPLLIQTNEASMMESIGSFSGGVQSANAKEPAAQQCEARIALPTVAPLHYDFAKACRRRFSPGLDFMPGHLDLENLAVLLAETATAATEFEMSHERGFDARISVGVCAHGVEGLDDGAYIYDANTHSLGLVRSGDHRLRLQSGMSMPTVNFFHVPVCVHLIGSLDSWRAFGYRGYRINQMEIGMILQRLLLTASALGMNGHPLLGYDEGDCDAIYGLGTAGETCLIEIPIGFYRKTSRFEGTLRR